MKVNHVDAIELEELMCQVFRCGRFGVGGFVDADILEDNPFEATILCVGKLYNGHHEEEISSFARKWRSIFEYPEESEEYTMVQYIKELEELIRLLKGI